MGRRGYALLSFLGGLLFKILRNIIRGYYFYIGGHIFIYKAVSFILPHGIKAIAPHLLRIHGDSSRKNVLTYILQYGIIRIKSVKILREQL